MRPDPSRSGSKHHDRDGPKVRLADARKVAMQINDWLRDGIDPRGQSSRQRRERERPEAKPFREVAEAWFAHHATAWSPRYRRDMREKLDHFVLPALGQVAIGVLGRTEIEDRLLAPIVARGANEQARRCNDVVRRVLEHAMDLELRSDNPATRTRHPHPQADRHDPRHALPPDQLGGAAGVVGGDRSLRAGSCRRTQQSDRSAPDTPWIPWFRAESGFGQRNCIEQLKIARVVTEKQLAHADGNKVSRAYDWAEYLEERSEMMQRWADLLDQVAVNAGLAPVAEGPLQNDSLTLLAG